VSSNAPAGQNIGKNVSQKSLVAPSGQNIDYYTPLGLKNRCSFFFYQYFAPLGHLNRLIK
jgi:hypothetical protein